MHNEPLSVRVHSCSRLIAIVVLTCCAATPGLQAAARAVPTAPIQSPAVQQPYPVQPAGVAAPAVIQPANPSISSPPIKASGTPGAGAAIPKLMEPDENDTDAERIRKLEATALSTPRKGSPAERNAARTAWLLGLLYLHGEHAPLDPVKAKKWFERAKALNEPLANAGLAWCEIDGCGENDHLLRQGGRGKRCGKNSGKGQATGHGILQSIYPLKHINQGREARKRYFPPDSSLSAFRRNMASSAAIGAAAAFSDRVRTSR